MQERRRIPGAIARLALITSLVMVAFAPARATEWLLQALLTGDQEVPPTGSSALGVGIMYYDDVSNLFHISIFVDGITTAQLTGSHVHRGPVGVNGPVQFGFNNASWSDTFGGMVLNLMNAGPLPEDNEVHLLSNNNYLNVHTNAFPGGEIRGQLIVVPEPATMVALAAGLGLLAARRRRS